MGPWSYRRPTVLGHWRERVLAIGESCLQPPQRPFERGDESALPFQTANQLYFIVPGQAVVARWLATFKDFPPRQKPVSVNVDEVLEKIMSAAAQGPGR